MTYLIVGGIVWLTMAALGGWTAAQKRRPETEGVVLGLLFGPLGVLIEVLLPVGDVRPVKHVEPVDRAAERRREWQGFALVIGGMICLYVASYIFGK